MFLDLSDALNEVSRWRLIGQSIVFTTGVFDMLHSGHIVYLKKSRACGDRLIVGVDSDALVLARKGAGRPIQAFEERVEQLLHLGFIDMIIRKDPSADLFHYVDLLKPDLFVISTDTYSNDERSELAKRFGGSVKMLERTPGISTTELLRKT